MQAAPASSHASAVNGEHPRREVGGGTNPASQSCRISAVKKQTCNQSWAKSQPIWRIPVLLRPRGCDRAAVAWGLTSQCCRLRLMVVEFMYFKGHQIKSVWPPEGKHRFLFICVQEKKRALVTRTSAGKINNGDTVAQNVHNSCWVLLNGSASWLHSFYPSVSVPSWEFGTVQSITWKAASAAGGFLCVRLCFAPDFTYKVLYGFLWSLFTFAANSDKPIFLFEILSKSEKRIWSLDV